VLTHAYLFAPSSDVIIIEVDQIAIRLAGLALIVGHGCPLSVE
jgi:hypothetical protein